MKKPSVAFYDAKPYDKEYFRAEAGDRLEFDFHSFSLGSAVADSARGAFAVCAFVHDILDAACLEVVAGAGVRMVAMRCAGYNYVDLEAAERLGLVVTRVPAYSPAAVAEHAVALLLTLVRKVHRAHSRIREHNFSLNGLVGFDIEGKTVGVIGCGKIGKKAAQIFRGFDARVLAYDPYPDTEWAARHGVEMVSLEDLWGRADILSLHVPLTSETEYLLNERTLALTKPGVIIINTSRGKLVDTGALLHGLRSGHVGGVCLDVYEEEDHYFYYDRSEEIIHNEELAYLLTFHNVLVTAHQAFLTREALSQIARVSVENILAAFEGREPLPGTALVTPGMRH